MEWSSQIRTSPVAPDRAGATPFASFLFRDGWTGSLHAGNAEPVSGAPRAIHGNRTVVLAVASVTRLLSWRPRESGRGRHRGSGRSSSWGRHISRYDPRSGRFRQSG